MIDIIFVRYVVNIELILNLNICYVSGPWLGSAFGIGLSFIKPWSACVYILGCFGILMAPLSCILHVDIENTQVTLIFFMLPFNNE